MANSLLPLRASVLKQISFSIFIIQLFCNMVMVIHFLLS